MNKMYGAIAKITFAISMNTAVQSAPIQPSVSIYLVSNSHATAQKVIQIVTNTDLLTYEYWLSRVGKQFPDIHHNNALILSIRHYEDIIQELHDPVRDIGMNLVQKLSETSTPEILMLEKRETILSSSEKNKLDTLKFKKNQGDLATLLLFLINNPPEDLQQCKKPDNNNI